MFDLAIFEQSKAWAFEEAFKILKKIGGKTPEKGYVLFETGYGPSGLPHIGTFGEVVRTCFVQFAFETITEGKIPTKLMCISDDLDGFRKVPENIPNKEAMKEALGKPLTSVPDPFGTHSSYGKHMNERLCGFLDSFGFKYEFVSATEMYNSGKFNDVLLKVVANYEKIMELMLSNLGQERGETYSPLMPISPITGKVLAEGVKGVNKEKGTVIYENENGETVEISVLNGNCKLQWKVDFGGRWAGLDVDYEIFGKEHAPNAQIYQAICKILGGKGPVNFVYELFLGEDGAKISKSKGNGISVEEWLSFAPSESLKLFMYQKPKTAKRLYFDTIPKMVDDYIKYIKSYATQTPAERLENPAFFIHSGEVPSFDLGVIDYSLLLHLVSASSAENADILWGFINKYNSNLKKGDVPFMDKITESAIQYFEKFIKPNKKFRKPEEAESKALTMLLNFLKAETNAETKAEEIQNKVYQIGKDLGFDLKSWFSAIYQILLGSNEGPRVGSFIKLYGIENTIKLISEKLA
jgi:lysyl-tRNA synthetase class 1